MSHADDLAALRDDVITQLRAISSKPDYEVQADGTRKRVDRSAQRRTLFDQLKALDSMIAASTPARVDRHGAVT